MNSLKRKNMMTAYDGFKGDQTVTAVMSQIPAELLVKLTGKEIGLVMSAVNAAYHNGKVACGAEKVDDCVWIEGKLLPLAAIKSIVVEKKIESVDRKPTACDKSTVQNFTVTSYKMDFTERF